MSENNVSRKKRGGPRIHNEKRSSPYTKIGKGAPLRGQARELVCNVRNYFTLEKENNGPLIPVAKVVDRTADALNIHPNTVVNISAEKKRRIALGESSRLTTPSKKRTVQRRVTKLDTFQQDAIRSHVYGYYRRKEHPTLKKLLVSLKELDLFNGSRSSLYRLLKFIGFKYKTINKRRVLLERTDIVAKRCTFLREILKEDMDKIIWIDETWVNTGHTLKKGWTDDSVEGTIAVPIGKGERLILLHAGSSSGFVPGCSLLFHSTGKGDYHEEMNSGTFYTWFKSTLLPKLQTAATIVMDNASYHSKILEKTPTMYSSKKVEMQEWLQVHGLQFEEYMTKSELMQLIEKNKPDNPVYVIDELAKEYGHKIIRIPPYHCHFNSIEMIWAQIKGHVARNNKKFTVTETKKLTQEGIERVTATEWKKVVDHTKKVITEAWENEGLLEESVERLVFTVNNSEDESLDDEEDDGDYHGDENRSCYEDRRFENTFQYELVDVEDNSEESLSGFSPLSPCQEKVLNFSEF